MPAIRQPITTPGSTPGDPRWVRELKDVLRRLSQAIADACYTPDGVTIVARGRTISALPTIVLHPFKLWIKPYSGGWKYAICEQEPGTAGAIAGRIHKLDGVELEIAAVDWTAISATTTLWLKIIISGGTYTCTFETAAPTPSIDLTTITLGYVIGTITFRNGVPIVTLQKQNSNIDLTTASTERLFLAKITGFPTLPTATCTCSIYAAGAAAAATQVGAIVHLYASMTTAPPVNAVWLIVRQLSGTTPPEFEAVPVQIDNTPVTLPGVTFESAGALKYYGHSVSIDYNDVGEICVTDVAAATASTIVTLDGDGLAVASAVLKIDLDTTGVDVVTNVSYNTTTGVLSKTVKTLSLGFTAAGKLALLASSGTDSTVDTAEECP